YYKFTGVPAGFAYSVEPAPSNAYFYTPTVWTIPSLESHANRQSFVAKRKLFAVSGRVTNPAGTIGLGSVRMSLYDGSGALVKAVTTSSNGNYSLADIPGGSNYRLVPTKAGLTFTPAARSYTNLPSNLTLQNFTGK
ncbi:MAG TPA: carboxypeptidase-like regulatory domain-containing protein, partial [Pyrinomonadaceae bacterium]|nr:carboxypeptidase-like regulatory domain-containing protein [Pyrinomonadaceae bacterium]